MTKYDFLVTDIQDKILMTILLLQEDGHIEKDLSLKEIYNKYLHPNVLPLDNQRYWEALENGEVLNVFQFDSEVGSQAAKKIKPRTILELSDSNGLMRLMASEKGAEPPMEKYIRYKNNLDLWYQEMKEEYGLTQGEIETVTPYFKPSYGVPPSQEQLMQMLMDKDICNFSLAEANDARKTVGKKLLKKVPALKQKVLQQAKSPNLGHYIWKCGIGPQMSYSFSIIHALAYSFIGFQTLYLATNWNIIYWNTACLIVNSGALEDVKKKTTDYGKNAKAIGEIINHGIKISLVNINNSDFSFSPDCSNNTIRFGLKGINKIGDPVIEQILKYRPYTGLNDFINRCPINKTAVINLIKAGAFDELDNHWAEKLGEVRTVLMSYYLYKISNPKSKLTLSNFNGILNKNILPEYLNDFKMLFLFNKNLKSNKNEQYYILDTKQINYITDNYSEVADYINYNVIPIKIWDKYYKKQMDAVRPFLNDPTTIELYNYLLFKENWEKYALETSINLSSITSAWEMESLCFYAGEHELKNINYDKYGISHFFDLSEIPEVDYYFKRKDKQIPIYKTYKIVGTILAKNDARSSISLLTEQGVVNVKFTKEYYAMFGRQLSEKQEDGTKKIIEKGWFSRGQKIMVTGYRRDDTFVAKTYSKTPTHQLYKITAITNDGDIEIEHERNK